MNRMTLLGRLTVLTVSVFISILPAAALQIPFSSHDPVPITQPPSTTIAAESNCTCHDGTLQTWAIPDSTMRVVDPRVMIYCPERTQFNEKRSVKVSKLDDKGCRFFAGQSVGFRNGKGEEEKKKKKGVTYIVRELWRCEGEQEVMPNSTLCERFLGGDGWEWE